MTNWQECLIEPSAPILNAIRMLSESGIQICLVTDETRRLVGTVTDGDIRRGILKNISLESPVEAIMNRTPKVIDLGQDRVSVLRVMTSLLIRQIPVVDSDGRVVGLELLDRILSAEDQELSNWVVLMAGGLGKRLRPLTEDTPKPMLEVGGVPILEVALNNIRNQGFRRFMISVNYKAEMVKQHFGDGRRFNADIRYLEEDRPLGTAGPLGLIDPRPEEPVVVMNGDILTKVNAVRLLDYHREQRSRATMAVSEYDVQVPFGVVTIDGTSITGIEEKPVHRFFVNAGMYVLEPEVVASIAAGTRLDMPDLFRNLIETGQRVTAFPVREYWLDIGRHADFHKANQEYTRVFIDENPAP